MDKEVQQRFERQAERIKSYLKSPERYDDDFLPRPFFVELTGSPSAGKTTTIKELDKFLRRHGFRVFIPQEGAEQIRHIPRTTPEYNVRTALYALTQLMDLSYSSTYDIVIFDRGIFDPAGWMHYWKEKGKLSEEERQFMQDFFLFRLWIDRLDLAYIMVCDPEVAIEREHRIALSEKLGSTTNPETIQQLIDRYRKVYEDIESDHPQLHWLNTSNLTEEEMVKTVATKILDMMERKAHQNGD